MHHNIHVETRGQHFGRQLFCSVMEIEVRLMYRRSCEQVEGL